MLKNLLASIGFGSAKVDTLVDDPVVAAGGVLSGAVTMRGGDVEQKVGAVSLELVTRCIVEARGDEKVYGEIVVASARAAETFVLAPGDYREFAFELTVPDFAPLSVGSTSTFLRTRLEVAAAVDPSDSDAVKVVPNAAMESVFDGMERAGFRLAEVEVEYNPRRRIPFLQEFDFKPARGCWGVNEVEIAFLPAGDGDLEVLVTVDRRGGLFSFGGEAGYQFRVPAGGADPASVADAVRSAIGR